MFRLQNEEEAMQAHILHCHSGGPERLNSGLLQVNYVNHVQNCIQSVGRATYKQVEKQNERGEEGGQGNRS